MNNNSNDAARLCPSYKQVDTFGPDEDYEDEEIAYVTLDLGSIEPTLVPSSSTYRLIGLDTPTPFLQLSGTIFKGQHSALLGTELLFTDSKDPHDKNKRSIAHVANTEKRICFREVRLQPKGMELAPSAKQREKGGVHDDEDIIHPVLQLGEASQMVDKVSGKNPARVRAPRRKKADKDRALTKGKGKRSKEKGMAIDKSEQPQKDSHKVGGDGAENDEAMDVEVEVGEG